MGTFLSLALSLNTWAQEILSVDYSAHHNPYFSVKTGVAAVGTSSGDFWNVYSRDVSNLFDWRPSGTLEDLKWVDGSNAGADLHVENAEGAWYTFSADAMMESYLYPLGSGGDIVSTLSNLPPHVYDVYVYAHGQPDEENGVVNLMIDEISAGEKSTSTSTNWDSATWGEGNQYVVYHDINIYEGAIARVISKPGSSGLAVMNGLQFVVKGPALPAPTRISVHPKGGIAFEGDSISLSVTALGTGLQYQWSLDGAVLEGATNASLQVTNFSSANAGIYTVSVTGDTGNATSAPANWIIASRGVGAALNIDFTAHLNAQYKAKVGPAAFGVASNDFWNVYSRDVISTSIPPVFPPNLPGLPPSPPFVSGPYTNFVDRTLTNLVWSDGTVSLATLSVSNARGAWFFDHSDNMMGSYLYPSGRRGNITATFSKLPPALYDLYVYAHGVEALENSIVKITVDGAVVGSKATSASTNWNSVQWIDGNQLVIFQDVNVFEGAIARIVSQPGESGLAVLNGAQWIAKGAALPPPPKIVQQPQGGVGFADETVVLTVSAQGADLTYQWSLNEVPIEGATEAMLTITNFSKADVGTYTVEVIGASGAIVSAGADWILASRAPGALFNIDFTAHLNPAFSVKTGPAAFGISPYDKWNSYSRDVGSLFDWRDSGAIPNLVWADGTISVASLTVRNANGAWFTLSADPMMKSYLYPLSGQPDVYTVVSNLPPQRYNIYVYAHGQPANENGVIELKVGGTVVGTKSTTSGADWGQEAWAENNQYVLFSDVDVADNAAVEIISHPGVSGLAVLNGVQIAAQQPVVQTFAKSMIRAASLPSTQQTAKVTRFVKGLRFDGNKLQLMLEGLANGVYHVEASADLVNWDTVGYYQSATGLIAIEDAEASEATAQFYRATQVQ